MVCIKCNLDLSLDNFRIRSDTGKYLNTCKSCCSIFQAKYREEHREKVRATSKAWREQNLERARESFRRWRRNNLEYARQKEKEQKLKECKNNPLFRIRKALARRIQHAIRDNQKSARTLELLGCSLAQFKAHIESQFQNGMSWENYGQWHIDHIKPCVSFDLSNPLEQKTCFRYSNLQPLWAKDNLKKGAKMPNIG